jgi:radical SAM protein with 4Fe4S-binding SPASM domain
LVKTDINKHTVNEFVNTWKGKVDRIRIYEEHSKNGAFGSINRVENLGDRKPCFKPFNEMVVYWNGKVCLCNHDWDRQGTLGDATIKPLEELWNDSAYRTVRQLHLDGKYDSIETCCSCNQWQAYYTNKGVVGDLITE